MRRLLFFTLAVSILMFLLVSTANAVSLVSQERVTAGEGTAQVVMICDAIVARENVEVFGYMKVRMADIWTPRSFAENKKITQTENAAPGDQLSIVSTPIINCGSTWTLSMIGRAAPGIRSAIFGNWSY